MSADLYQRRSARSAGPVRAVVSTRHGSKNTDQARAVELGLKIGTFPTALLAPVAAAIQAGLAALLAGKAEVDGVMSPADFRTTFGYPDYEAKAASFVLRN